MAGQVILSVAYGIDMLLQGDPFVEDAENILRAMGVRIDQGGLTV